MKAIPAGYIFSNKDLKKLIFPLVIEQFLAFAVGMADSIMVASVGESAMSAVSLVDTINQLLLNVFAALATGGAVVAGQFIGRMDKKRACKAGEQLVVLITVISLVIMAFMYLGKDFILHVVFGNIAPDVMAYSKTYLLIVSASIPFIAIYNGGAALFRAMGNSKIPMQTSVLMNGINICGNAILIYGFHMKVEGAAIPTLVSRIVAAVVILVLIRNQTLPIHISRPFRYRFDKGMVKKILYIGVPNGIENSMFQLGKILLLSLVATFGTASIAANAVANTIAGFEVLPGIAVGMALVTVVSQCVGAGDYEQVRFYTKKLMKYAYGAIIITNVVMMFLIPAIVAVYHLTPVTAELTTKIAILHGICASFIWPLSFIFPNTLRSSNDVGFSMYVGILSMWIFRIGFGFFLGKYFGFGVIGVWIAMIIDWAVRSVCFVIRYRGNRWQHI